MTVLRSAEELVGPDLVGVPADGGPTGGAAFVGREPELAILRDELREARSAHPRVMVVEGEEGIGKTSLVERFLALQEHTGLRVLRASGERWEALVSYGLLDQLARGAAAGGVPVDLLPAGGMPAGAGARLLDTFGALAAQGPLVTVVDDGHWADVDSLRALSYALRRLVDERVLVLFVVRPEDGQRIPDGLRKLAGGTTGRTLRLPALDPVDVQRLAAAHGVPGIPARVALRLHAHTRGNPLYITSLLTELVPDRWQTWEPELPAPRAFAASVARRLDGCTPAARRMVEAAAVLGGGAPLAVAGVLGGVAEPLAAVEEAGAACLLEVRQEPGLRDVYFPHPLVRAAVYERLGTARRAELHRGAGELADDRATALRHRTAAVTPPDDLLAAELTRFAEREAAREAFANAAFGFGQASRFSTEREQREQLLLRAVEAVVDSGDLVQATVFADEITGFPPSPMRDAALGYLAILRGRPSMADKLLRSAWRRCRPADDPARAAVVALRHALHALGHLRGAELVTWAERARELAPPGGPVAAEAEAVHELGEGWMGRPIAGERPDRTAAVPVPRGRLGNGWVRLAADDLAAARDELTTSVSAGRRLGSSRSTVWASCWLARTNFLLGAWDDAVLEAQRAVALVEETGHDWLRPLAAWVATSVAAARGEFTTAEEHVRTAWAEVGDYELSIAAFGLARAELAAARGDHEGVLRAGQALLAIRPREAIDEPGFLPWQDLYADALMGCGRVAEADAFLRHHEKVAAARERPSAMARLARARGRIDAARGDWDGAEAAFRSGIALLDPLPMPFDRAVLELAYGQALRRAGKRRAAAAQLDAARERLAVLRAQPYLERCERELMACGQPGAERQAREPGRLTAQELAVARLVAAGMSNRQVAAELFVSIKTVQFHLTHIYAKLGVASRAELAAGLRSDGPDAGVS